MSLSPVNTSGAMRLLPGLDVSWPNLETRFERDGNQQLARGAGRGAAEDQNRIWKPGELIPNEADLAIEFGCARATVNRALRALAETGILDRRRKAGTRVALHPVRKVTLEIPIIRHEVEQKAAAL